MMIEQSRIDNAKSFNLVELIKSRGIEVKKQGNQYLALCPFHNDHNPSLSIDTKTNLFKCFGCGKSGDSIRFIELYEQKSFPRAVDALTGGQPVAPAVNIQQLLNRVTEVYHETLTANPKAQDYLTKRGIEKPEIVKAFRLGYADGRLLATLPKDGPMVEALKTLGVITKSGKELFYGCVIFPLPDADGNTVGIYGRKITDGQVNHLYLPGKRRGVFNRQAAAASDEIILTESVIDALSLYQNGFVSAIPLYGTNGLTDDHLELFHTYRPKKIYLCLNNDEPGRTATAQIAKHLKESGFTVGIVPLTGSKDLNEYFLSGKTFEDFTGLLIDAGDGTPTGTGHNVVKTDVGLLMTCQDREYRVRGISLYSLERLRVNIKAICGDKYHVDTIDLYQSKARRYFTAQISRLFAVPPETIDADLLFMLNQIEKYQAEAKAAEEKPKEAYHMTKEQEAEAVKLLQSPKLLEMILTDMDAMGHVGEETNKILAYLIAVSRKLPKPLSGIIISGSSAGKSNLMENVQELTPPEEVEFFSRITPQALYYMERDALKRKLLIIEERAGGEGADYSIRTLQSKQKLTQAVPIKDPSTGAIRTMTFEVEGPIAFLETTTSAEINHENATRCFELYLDESIEQTRRIHAAQRAAKTGDGLSRKLKREAIKTRHHNLQRMLKMVMVEIPYAPLMDFPADSLRTRRDHERFLSLIEAVTFLHQYQRKQKEIVIPEGEKAACVLSNPTDYAIAYNLAREILGFTLDDLKKHARELLEQIQAMIGKLSKQTGEAPDNIPFTRRDIREFTGWPDHQIKAHIKQLEEMEYLIIETTKARGQFAYKLNNPNQRKPLKGLLTPEELKEKLTSKTVPNLPASGIQPPASRSGTAGRNADSTGHMQQ